MAGNIIESFFYTLENRISNCYARRSNKFMSIFRLGEMPKSVVGGKGLSGPSDFVPLTT